MRHATAVAAFGAHARACACICEFASEVRREAAAYGAQVHAHAAEEFAILFVESQLHGI